MRPAGTIGLPPIQTGTVSNFRSAGLFMSKILRRYTGPMSARITGPLVPAHLAFASDGTPYSEEYGDVYHAAAGAEEQARHVFLHGNGLPERWRGRRSFTILEAGFGLGLSFAATLKAWRADPK